MSTDQDSQVPRPRTGRDRRHLYPGRSRAVNAKFTDDEYAELAAAAELAGLTPTGFCAQAALDTARNLNTLAGKAENHALGNLQAELFHARVALNQLGAELGRLRERRRDEPEDASDCIAARVVHTLVDIDSVISHIHRRLAHRSTP